MKDEHKRFFEQMPQAEMEYEIHADMANDPDTPRWMSVDFGSDREELMKKMNDSSFRYFDLPRRLVAVHTKAEVVDWLGASAHFGISTETHLPDA